MEVRKIFLKEKVYQTESSRQKRLYSSHLQLGSRPLQKGRETALNSIEIKG